MRCLPGIRLLLIALAVLVVFRACLLAQDDPNDTPLGDVARNLRKKGPAMKQVIDDDNLPQVMQRADDGGRFGSSLRYLMTGENKGFQVSAPDATCSLSFSANVKSLLSGQYSQMDLPPDQMGKVQGQATIEGDSLTIPVFNGTNWHVSELAVALTVIHKGGAHGYPGAAYATAGVGVDLGQSESAQPDPLEQVRSEKRPDTTVIYKIRNAAPPWERAVFSAPLNLDIAPGEEWHWAIVQAKGYPPESYAATQRKTEPTDQPNPVPVSLTDPENPLAVTPQHP